jgi:hypothetical protein
MKSGAGDDPFADETSDGSTEGTGDAPAHDEPASSSGGATHAQSLPYKYRRDSVKQGRNQQPVFLQATTETLIDETIDRIEDRFDEDVYKTDVVEAMLVAGGEGTTPEAVLERWGYGLKNG